MKNLFSLIIIYLVVNTILLGQQEVKQQSLELQIGIIELASSKLNFSLEYIPTERFGAEINTGIQVRKKSSNFSPSLISDADFYSLIQAKFYLFPKYGGDRLYVGAYGLYEYDKTNIYINQKIEESKGSFGCNLGYKWVIASRALINYGFGFGKTLRRKETIDNIPIEAQTNLSNFNFLFYISIGYRFRM